MAPRPFKRRAAQPDPAEPEVAPGRLTEVPTADASGMERRAFGEFTSLRGELASYAFGWVTGAEPHEARVGHLHHLVDEDPTLAEVLDLAPGEEAVRDVVGGAWTRTTAPPEPSA